MDRSSIRDFRWIYCSSHSRNRFLYIFDFSPLQRVGFDRVNIYFTETEKNSEEFYDKHLANHDLSFVSELQDVEADVECLSVFIHSRINGEFIAKHPALKFIATRSTGFDHIDLEACTSKGVVVSFVPSYGENTVAEHTFALLLAISRRLRQTLVAKRSGRFSFEELRGFDLKQKTIGIVGAGRIGLHVIRIAKAFGMDVLAADVNQDGLLAEVLGFEYVPLDNLLQRSHIVSLHTPLTPQTVHLINRETLAKCRQGVIILNTARGGLINTGALLAALESGHVAGAGLDVLEDERVFRRQALDLIAERIVEDLHQTSSPEELHLRHPERLAEIQALTINKTLLSRPDVIFTPHVAFNSAEAVQRIDHVTLQNILAFIDGKPVNTIGV